MVRSFCSIIGAIISCPIFIIKENALYSERSECVMNQGIKGSGIMGSNIGRFRAKKSLTQDELAAKMQSSGCDISRGTLAKIEAGIRHLSVEELEVIRRLLGMEYADFFQK